MKLDNSVALVTGGAGGLGEAAVRRIVATGGSVIIADLADDKAAKLAEDLGPTSVSTHRRHFVIATKGLDH